MGEGNGKTETSFSQTQICLLMLSHPAEGYTETFNYLYVNSQQNTRSLCAAPSPGSCHASPKFCYASVPQGKLRLASHSSVEMQKHI